MSYLQIYDSIADIMATNGNQEFALAKEYSQQAIGSDKDVIELKAKSLIDQLSHSSKEELVRITATSLMTQDTMFETINATNLLFAPGPTYVINTIAFSFKRFVCFAEQVDKLASSASLMTLPECKDILLGIKSYVELDIAQLNTAYTVLMDYPNQLTSYYKKPIPIDADVSMMDIPKYVKDSFRGVQKTYIFCAQVINAGTLIIDQVNKSVNMIDSILGDNK